MPTDNITSHKLSLSIGFSITLPRPSQEDKTQRERVTTSGAYGSFPRHKRDSELPRMDSSIGTHMGLVGLDNKASTWPLISLLSSLPPPRSLPSVS